MADKRIIEVDEYQHGLILNALNDKRNELAEQGKDTEFVDDTLMTLWTRRRSERNIGVNRSDE